MLLLIFFRPPGSRGSKMFDMTSHANPYIVVRVTPTGNELRYAAPGCASCGVVPRHELGCWLVSVAI